MSTVTEYSNVGTCRLFPAHATDLLTFRQRRHPQFPDLPCWTAIISKADLELVKERGKSQVPTRNKNGYRLSEVYNCIKGEKRRRDFAEKEGWPFTVHIQNLAEAEQI
jgi:hypothetical protein